jgi:hypothetical protein
MDEKNRSVTILEFLLPYEVFQEASFWRSCVVYLVDGREILENENSDNCGLILENATSNSIPSGKSSLLCQLLEDSERLVGTWHLRQVLLCTKHRN